jgi:hypothetical protein
MYIRINASKEILIILEWIDSEWEYKEKLTVYSIWNHVG